MNGIERFVRVGLIAWLSGAGFGCADAILRLGADPCDAFRVPTDRLAPVINVRARFLMDVGGRAVGFDAIAQREGGALYLVGLATPGGRLFALRQDGEEVAFVDTPRGGTRALAIRALDALGRGLWITPPAAVLDAEPRAWTIRGERVLERETPTGRSRTYHPAGSGRNASRIRIEYHGNGPRGPRGFEVDHPGCRYGASVVLIGP